MVDFPIAAVLMCHSLFCCNHMPALRTAPLYYLARLRLAAGTAELLPHQMSTLDARLNLLWEQLSEGLQRRLGVPAQRARYLVEQLLQRLLRRACCCRALRRTVPLSDALGPMARCEWFATDACAA